MSARFILRTWDRPARWWIKHRLKVIQGSGNVPLVPQPRVKIIPFAVSGTYVVPADVRVVPFTLYGAGAGGAGGGGGATAAAGGGGGGGTGGNCGNAVSGLLAVVPGEVLTITIGAGGAGGGGGAAGADGSESAPGTETTIAGSLETVVCSPGLGQSLLQGVSRAGKAGGAAAGGAAGAAAGAMTVSALLVPRQGVADQVPSQNNGPGASTAGGGGGGFGGSGATQKGGVSWPTTSAVQPALAVGGTPQLFSKGSAAADLLGLFAQGVVPPGGAGGAGGAAPGVGFPGTDAPGPTGGGGGGGGGGGSSVAAAAGGAGGKGGSGFVVLNVTTAY